MNKERYFEKDDDAFVRVDGDSLSQEVSNGAHVGGQLESERTGSTKDQLNG